MIRQQRFTDYEGFVEKFKPKKTTDDCYTPQPVYDVILEWCRANIPAVCDATEIVRPFYPGGDYEAHCYPAGSVVVDNPPFSILAKIVDFYRANGVAFVLFGPQLTLGGYCGRPDVTAIVCDAVITYANGANVNTGFLTNIWPTDARMVVRGDLHRLMEAADKQQRAGLKKTVKKVNHHPNVTSAALLGKICFDGISLEFPREESAFVRSVGNYSIFGGGL